MENKDLTPSQEIELLRQRVQELEAVNPVSERKVETILEAVKQHTEQMPISVSAQAATSPLPDDNDTKTDGVDIIVDEHGVDMHKFLSLVEEKSVWYALDVARKTSPHLLDDFHSVVVQYLKTKHGF